MRRTPGTPPERRARRWSRQILNLFLRADDLTDRGAEAQRGNRQRADPEVAKGGRGLAPRRRGGGGARAQRGADTPGAPGWGSSLYIQLGSRWCEKASTAELYVFSSGQKGKAPAEPGASVILWRWIPIIWDGGGAGVRARDKNVHLRLRAEGGAALRMFEERMPVLDRRCATQVSTLTHAALRAAETPVLPDTAQDAAERLPDTTRWLDGHLRGDDVRTRPKNRRRLPR